MSANTMKLKACTIAELSELYGVCSRTLKKWIQPFEGEIGERRGRYYTVNQVKVIYDRLGLPAEITLD